MVTTKTKKLGNQGCFFTMNATHHALQHDFFCHHCCDSYAKSWCLCETIWDFFPKHCV